MVLTKENSDATVAHLNSRDPVDAHFKHWIKTKEFGIVDIPALQLVDALLVPNSAASKLKEATRHLRGQLYDVTKQYRWHVDWLAYLEMVPLSADRHMVLRHLKIADWQIALDSDVYCVLRIPVARSLTYPCQLSLATPNIRNATQLQ